MAEGLKPHRHQFYEDSVKQYRDDFGCKRVKAIYRCMICGAVKTEKYTCYEPPPETPKRQHRIRYKPTALERAKHKHGIHD